MSLQILPRILWGPNSDPEQCAKWPVPVSAFNLPWLKSFTSSQRDRLAKVSSAIKTANTEIEKMRAEFVAPKPIGIKAPNGNILLSGEDHAAALKNRTQAQNQLIRAIIVGVREPFDLAMAPTMKEMARSAATADVLRQRVFDKISCLARAGVTGLKAPEVMAFKASIMTAYRDVSPVELNRLIQAAIDDGSGDSLPLLDCLRMLNFSRPKDERGGDNARLLALANVPEFIEAAPLLDEVQSLNQQALLLWAQFHDHSSRVSVMKMSMGLAQQSTINAQDDPYADFR